MKLLKNITLTLLLLMVLSCENLGNSLNNEKTSKVQLINQQGIPIYVVNGNDNRLAIEAIIESKKPIMKKILPLFVTKLVIEFGDQKQVWMVAEPNYIKSTEKNKNQIYVINNDVNLFDHLKSLSE